MMRIKKLHEISEKYNNTCIIISGDSNIYYLTGYEGAGIIIYCDGVATLLAPLLEENRAKEVNGLDVKIYYPSNIASGILVGSVSEIIPKFITRNSVALDVNWSNIGIYKILSSKYNLIDISNDISEMRSIKDDDELEKIKKAGEITSEAMKVSMDKILEGEITEKQLSGIIDYTMKASGAEDYAFPSIVAAGKNSAFPHHIPTDKKILENEDVVIDIGAKFDGYCFDSTRTFNVKGEVKKIYEIVLEAQLEAIDAVTSGMSAAEIDKIARKVIEKYGYGRYFVHSTGHGVGIEVHESPYISFNSNDVLKKNMVITVEPGIYLKDKFGVRIEDTLVVTNGKPEVLETAYKLL
ncbi:aminopeptidase P family protein [Acidianus sp. HS-5]|uniref:M24 family metallopeptidase n=1 Tax=Acidianus sp. HS-5 TaxID=2886040 RepID=UPI001F44FDDE|nr:aminopeptidase P family protein [Acidianus sp. HS-5]